MRSTSSEDSIHIKLSPNEVMLAVPLQKLFPTIYENDCVLLCSPTPV